MTSDKLTARQEAFCVEYASNGGNATAAYTAVFHPKTENSAAACAARLLRNDKIKRRIRNLLDELAEPKISSMTRVKAFWSSVLADTEETTANRLRASELFAKAAGAFLRPKDADEFPVFTDYGGKWANDVIYYDDEAEIEKVMSDRERDGDNSTVIFLPRMQTIEECMADDDEDDETDVTDLGESNG